MSLNTWSLILKSQSENIQDYCYSYLMHAKQLKAIYVNKPIYCSVQNILVKMKHFFFNTNTTNFSYLNLLLIF